MDMRLGTSDTARGRKLPTWDAAGNLPAPHAAGTSGTDTQLGTSRRVAVVKLQGASVPQPRKGPGPFGVLYRDFLTRLVDLEILSTGIADVQRLLAQFAAMLAAASFTYAVVSVPRYLESRLPQAQILVAAYGEQEFLIASTMAIAGLFAVLAWNTMLPDRRDCFILGVLPVRVRTIFLAKVAALVTALAIAVAAVNSFTGFSFPFLWTAPDAGFWGGLHTFAAYWLTQSLAGLFVCAALLALQSVASLVLSYRLFLRISSLLQTACFFTILGLWFLKPPFTALATHSWLQWMPSFWFFGLFQQLNGGAAPQFAPLAARAIGSLPAAAAIAAACFSLAYRRNLHQIVEQPDIAPADRSRPATGVGSWLADRLPARRHRPRRAANSPPAPSPAADSIASFWPPTPASPWASDWSTHAT